MRVAGSATDEDDYMRVEDALINLNCSSMSTIKDPIDPQSNKRTNIVAGLAVLCAFQWVGEAVTRFAHLPVPGAVIGMALLFVALLVRGSIQPSLHKVSRGLLENLSLLFVPASVGAFLHWHQIAQEWLAITCAVVGSTILTIAVTAWLMHRLQPREEAKP